MEKCMICGSEEVINELVEGQSYCKAHRDKILFDELETKFASWNATEDPPERFCYLLGRLEPDFEFHGESYLSAARIRNRAFNWEKRDNGCRFEITRHPGAFTKETYKRVVQLYSVDLKLRKIDLLSERPFVDGDFDR